MKKFVEICRTCLSENEVLIPINSYIQSDLRISDYFKKYLQINMLQDNDLPLNICFKCFNKLLEVRKFYKLCQDSNNYLKLKLKIASRENKAKSNITVNDNPNELNENNFEQIILENDSEKEHLDEEINGIEKSLNNIKNEKLSENSRKESNNNQLFLNDEFAQNQVKPVITKLVPKIYEKHFKCFICNESFKYIKNLQFHMKLHPQDNNQNENKHVNTPLEFKSKNFFGERTHTCKHCQFKFAFRTNYSIHMKRHAQKRIYSNDSCICSICGKDFDDKKKLQKHMYEHNRKYKEHFCKLCNKAFKVKYDLQIHMNQHTGEKPFNCNSCNKKFSSPSSLRLHKILHDGKKVQCPVCDTKLAARAQLKLHMRIHTNERPYVCTQCPKSYKQMCALKDHIASHSVKSVQCDECSACFHSKNNLLSHKIKTHRPKRFHCNTCSKLCSTPYLIKSHLLSVHKIVVKDLNPYKFQNVKNNI